MRANTIRGWCVAAGLLLILNAWVGSAHTSDSFRNPMLPGDHPDPTILRVGSTYWTASTSGNWAPEFPLYRSTDLHRWVAAGAIFRDTPTWANRDFWAPELVSDGGRILVYYVARKTGAGLCVGVATAAEPQGPYEDHGPIECQEDGSIDPAFIRDEHGKPFLIWKEDGNSQHRPSILWAQPLAADLIHLTGEKTALLTNDPSGWEGAVIEAPYLLRHGGTFFLFYAGNKCCGVACQYAEGVARADHLLGPWTRDPANPIIRPNGSWKCPGHGTAVQTPQGDDFFVYHAYPASGFAYLGRETLLDHITWSKDHWPIVNEGRGPASDEDPTAPGLEMQDHFTGNRLGDQWRWPIGHEPQAVVAADTLSLTVPQSGWQSLVAEPLPAATYETSVSILPGGTAGAGLGLIGDASDDVVLSREGDALELWRADHGGRHTFWQHPLESSAAVSLRVSSSQLGQANFSYRVGHGAWSPAGLPFQLRELLPWDAGLRVGLVVDGPPASTGSFSAFAFAQK